MNKKPTPKAMQTIGSPRIQVVLTIAEGSDGQRYDLWLVLDIPDGNPPTTVLLVRSLDKEEATRKMGAIYTAIGERFGRVRNGEGSISQDVEREQQRSPATVRR